MTAEAKTTAPPLVAGTARAPYSVKVRTQEAPYEAFAQCAADERLVGGGCRVDRNQRDLMVRHSRPEAHGEDDTLGARWRCQVNSSNIPVTAYALCMWVPPGEAAARVTPANGPE